MDHIGLVYAANPRVLNREESAVFQTVNLFLISELIGVVLPLIQTQKELTAHRFGGCCHYRHCRKIKLNLLRIKLNIWSQNGDCVQDTCLGWQCLAHRIEKDTRHARCKSRQEVTVFKALALAVILYWWEIWCMTISSLDAATTWIAKEELEGSNSMCGDEKVIASKALVLATILYWWRLDAF